LNRYIGIDIHQNECHATVQDEDGMTVKQGYFQNSPSGFEDFFDGTGEAKVAIEASDSWQPVYDWLSERCFDVKLAHPHKTRIIAEAKIKTDCKDSEALADLVRADLIAEVYVPCDDMRDLRGVAKQRGKLVQERSKFKSRIKAQLRKKGIEYRERNLWTKSGKQWLKDLEINAVSDFLEVLKTLNERISKLEGEIEEIAGDMEEAQILMTIPGISYYTALTITAEIATVDRFPSPGHLCSYAGLVPSVKQSGEKEVHGPIQGGRPLLRWILFQATHNHILNAPNSHVTEFYNRLKQKKPKKLGKDCGCEKGNNRHLLDAQP